MRLALVPAALAAILALAVPAESGAAVTVGSDLSATVSVDNGCENISCTRVLFSVNGVEQGSPVAGVVVRWRAIGEGTVRLRLIRPAAGGAYQAGPASAPVTFPAGSERGDFATRLPIAAGDLLAVDGAVGNGVFMGARCGCPDPQFPGTARSLFWLPTIVDGEVSAPDAGVDGLEAMVNAEVEPDADGDGFGDETQDCAPADPARNATCTTPAPTPTPPTPTPSPAPSTPSTPAPTDTTPPADVPAEPAPPAAIPITAPATPSTPARPTARRCVVPNLRGRTVAGARTALRARRCRLGAVTRVRGRGVRRGRIVAQQPRAGRSLPAGTLIRVSVRR